MEVPIRRQRPALPDPDADRDDRDDPGFEAHAKAYLAFSRRDHTASTARTRQSLVEAHLIPCFRGQALADIDRRDVERLLVQNERLSPATRNRILSALSAMFKWAIELGYVQHNPAQTTRRAREHASPLPLVSLADQARLIEQLPPDFRALFLVALDSGARLGELLRLAWGDIELDTGAILLRRTKSGWPRIVRLSRRLCRTFAELVRVRHAGADLTAPVFKAATGAGDRLRWVWRRAFKRAAAAIGHPSLRVHDLRHLAAINLVRAGVDLPTVQAHLGHLHLISTLRYAAYADETASARAARALDEIHGEPPPRPPDIDPTLTVGPADATRRAGTPLPRARHPGPLPQSPARSRGCLAASSRSQ